MKSIKFLPIIFISCILSCQGPLKDRESRELKVSNKDFFVKNGVVNFYDADSYIRTLNYVGSLKKGDQLNFCKKNGFISFLQAYDDLLKSLDTSKKESYKKYIVFNNSTPELNFVTPIIAVVANQDGLLFIGQQLVRFVDDKEIVVKDGSIDKAINWINYTDKDRLVVSTNIDTPLPVTSKARVSTSSLCRRIYGTSGNINTFRDGATVETRLKRTYIPLGINDLHRIYIYGISTGTAVNSFFGGKHSVNNSLTAAYSYDVYDYDNQLKGSKDVYQVATNTGSSIVSTDSGVDAGTCYSFQITYYYGNLRPVPVVSPCGLWVACQYMFTKYVNDKFTVTADCTSDTQNEY